MSDAEPPLAASKATWKQWLRGFARHDSKFYNATTINNLIEVRWC